MKEQKPKVSLLVTCLVDFFRPSVAFATIQLIEGLGYTVSVPARQSCCGQIAFNNGDRNNARKLALQLIEQFKDSHYIVAPSGSCIGHLKKFPDLFEHDKKYQAEAQACADRSMELSCFLTAQEDIDVQLPPAAINVTYHDACSGLRELGIKQQPRKLLRQAGVDIVEMDDAEACCGFGGTFCVKYTGIANAILKHKSKSIEATKATTLVAGDMGCLMHIEGFLSRYNKQIEVRHLAEVLADLYTPKPKQQKD